MTPADHANTVREALKHTIVEVEGYTGPDVWWKPQVEAALAALDALQAQAEDIQREYIHLRLDGGLVYLELEHRGCGDNACTVIVRAAETEWLYPDGLPATASDKPTEYDADYRRAMSETEPSDGRDLKGGLLP